MSTVQEIEEAIRHLSPEELAAFRDWFIAFDAKLWDKQLEHDVDVGRLDKLADEALLDLRKGRCTDLWDTERHLDSGNATGNCPKRFSGWRIDAMKC
jgi:hypothetical protein